MSFPFDIHERINVNNKYRHCTIDMSLVIHKGDILFLLSMTLTVIILKLFFSALEIASISRRSNTNGPLLWTCDQWAVTTEPVQKNLSKNKHNPSEKKRIVRAYCWLAGRFYCTFRVQKTFSTTTGKVCHVILR